MNESIEARAASAPQAAVRAVPTHPMLTLVRRELWEHPALWVAPLVVSAALLLGAIFGRVSFPAGQFPLPANGAGRAPETVQSFVAAFVVLGFGFAQYFVMSVVLWFYATACLYNERRDRSILFWKSMPVSDAETVLSKALVAIFLVPAFVFAVTLLTSLAAYAIWSIRGLAGSAPPALWNGRAWLRAEAFSLVGLVAAVLWYAPLTAYLLAISAWARRNVQLWAILPPFIAVIVERIAFGTHHLSSWLLYRLGPGWQSQWEQWFERVFSGPFFYSSGGSGGQPAQLFSGMEPLNAFANIDLWIGLAVAAGLLVVAIRVRRYRDDT